MRRTRLYLDTSVVGGVLDSDFATDSQRLFGAIRGRKAVALISPLTVDELDAAPTSVRKVLEALDHGSVILLDATPEVVQLAVAYLEAEVVPDRFSSDAAHVAYATVYDADVVASWNFRHIVNLRRIQRFNAVNLAQGYRPIEIRSPRELFVEDDS